MLTTSLLAATLSAPPNVLLVFIDDMGWGDFSSFGNERVQTEHVDRLAAEGIRFERFYVNSPICSPSRVAISTGQYPQRHRITSFLNDRRGNEHRGMAQWLDPSAPMLARFLHKAGYATGHFGKWHMGGQRDVGEAPFITEYGFEESLTNFEGLGPRVIGIGDRYDGSPVKRISHRSNELGRGPVIYVDRKDVTGAYKNAAADFILKAAADGRPFYVNVWPDDVHSPFYPPKARRGPAKRDLYDGVLDAMDESLGELFDLIREDDRLRGNTLILVCSDNGPEQGAGSAGHLRGFKTHLYEGGVRSPLVAWGPGSIDSKAVGTVNRESVFSAIDLVPSVLSIAGVVAAADFDGEPLPDVLLGRSTESRAAPIFFRRPPDRDAFYGVDDLPDLAVLDCGLLPGDWKLLCEYDGSDAELYDLAANPSEAANVAAENPDVVETLTRAVTQWHAAMPPDNGPELTGRYRPPRP